MPIAGTFEADFTGASLLVCFAAFVAVSIVYLSSGVFVVGYLLNDTLLYTESAYRIANGQMPGIDFTNPMGIFAYLPLAVLYGITGDLARSVPISFVCYGFLIFIAASYVALTRLRLVEGCAVVLTCSILTASPWVLGYESGNVINPLTSAAMYYNKFGFSLVLISALFVIKPKWCTLSMKYDGIVAAAVFLLAYYTKMPFGLAVLALYLLWRGWVERNWQGAKAFAVASFLGIVFVEFFKPGLNLAYLAEIRFAAGAVGGVFQARSLIGHSLHLLPEIVILACVPVALGIAVGRLEQRHVVYIGCLIVGSAVLRAQSAQGHVLYTSLAVPVIVASFTAVKPVTERVRTSAWPIFFVLLYGVLEFLGPSLVGMARHAVQAAYLQPVEGISPRYAGLRVPTLNSIAFLNDSFSGKFNGGEAFAAARRAPAQDLFSPVSEEEYVTTLTDLPQARRLCGSAKDNTAIIDYANVASSYFGHRPVGAFAYAHIGRSYSEQTHLPPEVMFRDVYCIFLPMLPKDPEQYDGLMKVYGQFIRGRFVPAGKTRFWRVLVHSEAKN
jgi:hypothetical protein